VNAGYALDSTDAVSFAEQADHLRLLFDFQSTAHFSTYFMLTFDFYTTKIKMCQTKKQGKKNGVAAHAKTLAANWAVAKRRKFVFPSQNGPGIPRCLFGAGRYGKENHHSLWIGWCQITLVITAEAWK
jgi:hypothetical protein